MGEHEFRRKAQAYLDAARALTDPKAKSALIDMASRYMELAQQDRRIADLVQEAELLQEPTTKN
jgi:hypothetical protein